MTTSTPPEQGSPSVSMDAPATPGTHQRTLPPTTPGRPITSPFPTRTPGITTPGGTLTCTSDVSLFGIVTVHTAKCTECDKRNKDTMRRCPGCTFQVCKPCYDRREQEGRGLMHGNLASSAATPTTQRAVRRRPLGMSVPKAGSDSVEKKEETSQEDIVKKEGDEKKADDNKEPTSAPKSSGKKRVIRKKPGVQETTKEVSSDDDFVPDPTSPTFSKRRRTALAFDGTTTPTPTATPTARVIRRPPPSTTTPSYRAPSSSRSESTVDTPASGVKLGDLDVDRLMRTFGVNTSENPYQEHPLSRREPVTSNPVIEIPGIVKRSFKPRPTQEEIHRSIQDGTLKKMQDSSMKKIQDDSLKRMEAQQSKAEEDGYPHTVRALVETEAARHQDDVTMDKDENEALFSTMREAARKWGNQTHMKLDFATQKLVKRGLDLRLDKIDVTYKDELAKLMDECAARTLQELVQDRVASTALNPGLADDSTPRTRNV